MKNKIICLAVLILSLVAFAASFNRTQAYYYNSKGNSFFKEMKFQEARNEYNKSLEIKENSEVRNNIIKSLYEEKKYKEITETPSTDYFIRGNSYAFLGDEAVQQNPEEAIKNYKAALEEYKLAMKTSNDVNIKKNYEIVLKKIEDLNNQNQQNQNNQDKQNDKQDQNNEQDNKQNQQNQNNQDKQNDKQQNQNNQDKQNDKQDQNNEQDNKQNQQNQNNQDKQNDKQDQNNEQDNKQDQQNQNNQDKQNDKQDQNNEQDNKQNNIPQGEVQPIDSKDEGREGEVRAILKRLEGNEKQSFKNNERVINIGTGNSNNRW
ncbi:hypothetical protein [Fusobacterium sp.]|uniref:hypothetical protein n=1 Tax=Fusobacterium sp. TaxID=68766 RepID=UPI0029000D01|nr:hypothetical protein [Fusobacterium sp.]MDU1912194.1 hypothetical protein [Fusobacterium sp.]